MEEDPENPQAHRWWRKDFNSNVPEWMKEAKWVNSLFIASVVGVLLDPLFFYIPFIGEENRCIGMDTKLRNAALILRSLTDMPSLLPALPVIASLLCVIALLFYDHYVASELMLAIVTVIYQSPVQIGAFLPIPQVAILIGFYRRGFGNLHFSMILNVLLLSQYAVRVYRIHYLSKDLLNSRKLTKGAFNLFLFILSGNVLGAMLYFFSIQREALCWHQACRDTPRCTATFYCGDTSATTSTNTTFLNELCPVNSPNATVFDFGIYLNPLQSGNTGRVKFTTKLFYFFWWGIKNLSNFGTNLDTSSYVWENCFAILICLIGLLIFLYLIGNIQTYMQMQTAKEEELKELLPKTVKKRELIISWLNRHIQHNKALSKLTVRAFDKMVNENSHIGDVDVDVDVRYILSIGDRALRNKLQRELMTDALKKLSTLGRNSAAMYTFCEHLEPVVYTKNSYVVREGEPIDLMIFILDGTVWTYATSDDTNYAGESRIIPTTMPRTTIISKLGKGDFYGEELLSFALPENSFSHLPISTKNVKCRTEIEALVLTVDNWRDALQKFKYVWGIEICGGSEEIGEVGLRQNLRYIKLEKDALEWVSEIKESAGPEDI